jgi:hypothetical protein
MPFPVTRGPAFLWLARPASFRKQHPRMHGENSRRWHGNCWQCRGPLGKLGAGSSTAELLRIREAVPTLCALQRNRGREFVVLVRFDREEKGPRRCRGRLAIGFLLHLRGMECKAAFYVGRDDT